ncbi:MAG: tetratricopeptide repeat protein [Polyangia bacterium]
MSERRTAHVTPLLLEALLAAFFLWSCVGETPTANVQQAVNQDQFDKAFGICAESKSLVEEDRVFRKTCANAVHFAIKHALGADDASAKSLKKVEDDVGGLIAAIPQIADDSVLLKALRDLISAESARAHAGDENAETIEIWKRHEKHLCALDDFYRHGAGQLGDQGEISGAIYMYRKAVEADPSNDANKKKLSDLIWKEVQEKKDSLAGEKKISLLSEIRKLDPECWKARLQLGIALEKAGEKDEAAAEYAEVVEGTCGAAAEYAEKAGEKMAEEVSASAGAVGAVVSEISVTARKKLASLLLEKEDYDGAFKQYKELLDIAPDDKEARQGLKKAKRKR